MINLQSNIPQLSIHWNVWKVGWASGSQAFMFNKVLTNHWVVQWTPGVVINVQVPLRGNIILQSWAYYPLNWFKILLSPKQRAYSDLIFTFHLLRLEHHGWPNRPDRQQQSYLNLNFSQMTLLIHGTCSFNWFDGGRDDPNAETQAVRCSKAVFKVKQIMNTKAYKQMGRWVDGQGWQRWWGNWEEVWVGSKAQEIENVKQVSRCTWRQDGSAGTSSGQM